MPRTDDDDLETEIESDETETDDTDADDLEDQKPKKPVEDIEFWKNKAAKNAREAKNLRDRTHAAEEKAKAFDALEESKKSEQQRLEDRAAKAEELAAQTRDELHRERVQRQLGLTDAQARRLVGKTFEELLEDGEDLKATFGVASDKTDDDDEEKPKPKAKPAAKKVSGGRTPNEDEEDESIASIKAGLPPRHGTIPFLK